MKHSGKVYDFQDFVKCVEKANLGKVDIKELGESDFLSVEKMYHIKDVVKVTADRGKTTLLYSTKYEEFPSKELNFIQSKYIKKFPMPEKINKVRGFNKTKKKNIVEKLCPLMPSNRRGFWTSLPESGERDLIDCDE
ncbi:hypothetical protein J6590_105156 [Homalodisca vitripennis]|nr:hypothetical protein J6590_065694 [Homalodisca vitripennis]KAG8289397.1 hypothetical protein J6590_105156 [Homalodisca vitripennis]